MQPTNLLLQPNGNVMLCIIMTLLLLSTQSKYGSDFHPKDTINKTGNFIRKSDNYSKIERQIQETWAVDKDTLLAIKYARIYLNRGLRTDNDRIKYFANYHLAYLTYLRSKYFESIRYSEKSVEVSKILGDTVKSISSYTMRGSAYYVLGIYDIALESYLITNDLAKALKQKSYELISLTNIANCRIKLDQYQKAVYVYDEILTILEATQNRNTLSYKNTRLSSLLGKTRGLIELGMLGEAKEQINESIALAEKYNMPIYKGYNYVNLGDIFYREKEYHRALGYLKQGKEILSGNSNALKNNILLTNYYLALNHFALKNYNEVIQLLNTNFEAMQDKVNADKVDEMYELAIETSKILQDRENQILYYDQFQNLIQERNSNIVRAKDMLYADDLQKAKMSQKELENAWLKTVSSKNVLVFIIIILTIIFLVIMFGNRQKIKKDAREFDKLMSTVHDHNHVSDSVHHRRINKDKVETIICQLTHIEKTHFYLSEDCNLYHTAKLLSSNTTYLSKILNDHKNQTFNQYLNKLRIEYTISKLENDSIFRSYTIRAIAKEVGYKSHTTFIKAFKEYTGENPAFYIKSRELV